MSWMQRLFEVYENNSGKVGDFETRGEGQRFTLLPTSHVTQSAQIEIILDQDGSFFSAAVVQKDKSTTIVPASLDSANRSGSKVAPHYLHDKLFYVAGDYVTFGSNEKRFDNYNQYIAQMRSWVTSQHSHPKAKIIFEYVNKGTMIADLVKAQILFIGSDNKLIENWGTRETEVYGIEKPEVYKVVTGDSSEAFVRLRILSDDPLEPVIWEDKSLFEAFQHYYLSAETEGKDRKEGICYVTGQKVMLTDRHGSRIRNAGDMSKLISSNDSLGFTYRGRFAQSNEAVQIGYDVSQKAHNALRWLIQKQGYRTDERSFITFGVKPTKMIQPFDETAKMFDDPFSYIAGSGSQSIEKDHTRRIIAEQIKSAMQSKKHNFELDGIDQIIVMAVDAATRGRLSIVYYQEIDSSLFLNGLTHWHTTCNWFQNYYDANNKKVIHYIGAPSTYQIVESVYGPRTDARIKKELYTRLLPCIVERMALPKDVVSIIYNRIKNPMSFEGDPASPLGDWQRTLNVACALIRKFYEKEAIDMALDESNTNRDYLFGRLLGVAEVLERNELRNRNEKRATNALRYFNAFSQHPARTWVTIRRQLHPYQVRQGENLWFYNKLISEIEAAIRPEHMSNDALGPMFLLGYSSQINQLYQKKEQKEEIENDDDQK